MRKLKMLLAIVLVFCLCGCQKEVSILEKDPMPIEQKQLNKHHYTLDVTLDTKEHTIGGTMTVVVKNNSPDDWHEVYFRDYASNLSVDSKLTTFWHMDDGKADLDYAFDSNDHSVVCVTLNEPLKAGEEMTLNMAYTSYLLSDLLSRFNYQEIISDNQVIGHYALGNFYPVLSYYENGTWINHPYFSEGECFYTPISDYDVKITVPKDYVVSASSSALQTVENEDSCTSVYHLENARDFAFSAANDYQVLTEQADGITINSYFYAGSETAGQEALDEAVKGMKLFNRYLGTYPYETFNIAEVPMLPGGGMEYPGFVMIIERYYHDQFKALSNAVIHELAHQWFYGVVGNDEYDMPWLDESLASEMQMVYLSYFDLERFENEKRVNKNIIDVEGQANDSVITKAYDEFGSPYAYVNCAYQEGQKFLESVRDRMGEEAFIEALQTYVAKYAFLEAKTENLIEIFNEISKEKLLGLYQIYLEPQYYE